jgi:hypothetical protein
MQKLVGIIYKRADRKFLFMNVLFACKIWLGCSATCTLQSWSGLKLLQLVWAIEKPSWVPSTQTSSLRHASNKNMIEDKKTQIFQHDINKLVSRQDRYFSVRENYVEECVPQFWTCNILVLYMVLQDLINECNFLIPPHMGHAVA